MTGEIGLLSMGRFWKRLYCGGHGASKAILGFFKIYCVGSFAILIISWATVGTFGALALAPVLVIIWVIKVHQWSRKMNPTLLKRRDAKLLNSDLIK